jgi:hypothetical protein
VTPAERRLLDAAAEVNDRADWLAWVALATLLALIAVLL